ncbi:unnamed protein product [Cuscuta europaea]|uniref:Uncharacterized protein n=1 Tax=Cuscuta europaea TaxID=41803 RepID=A0A9P1EK65_CUSEU|nr:unnamed protein product [Cuscuta europaea]
MSLTNLFVTLLPASLIFRRQQVDIELNRNQNSKDVPAPNLNAMDFPALSVADNENRLPDYSRYDLQQELSLYSLSGKGSTLTFKSGSSVPDICSLDFASAVKKATSQNSSIWKFDKNGSIDERVRSSRSSNMLTNPYNGSQNRGSDSKG